MKSKTLTKIVAAVAALTIIGSACGSDDERLESAYTFCRSASNGGTYRLEFYGSSECQNGDQEIDQDEYFARDRIDQAARSRAMQLRSMDTEDCETVDAFEYLPTEGPRMQDDGSEFTFDCSSGSYGYFFTEKLGEHAWEAEATVDITNSDRYPLEFVDGIPLDFNHPKYEDSLTLANASSGTVACLYYGATDDGTERDPITIKLSLSGKSIYIEVDKTFNGPERYTEVKLIDPYNDQPYVERVETEEYAEYINNTPDDEAYKRTTTAGEIYIDYLTTGDDDEDDEDSASYTQDSATELGLMPYPSGAWSRNHIEAEACA